MFATVPSKVTEQHLAPAGIEDMVIGESPQMRGALEDVRLVAPTDAAVSICGETGAGKELFAHLIHALSLRRAGPYVKVNCSAIPAGLLESELFGHERGAFTGAVTQAVGKFERANQGTLFLDEIGDLPLELQPKLLRILQEQEFQKLGSSRTIRVNVRVVAATNMDLEQMVSENRFRADLFYRINVFPIAIPPLRERPGDIPALVWYFIRKHCARVGRNIEIIPDEVMDSLQSYAWPGNIRELQNFIERAVIRTSGPVFRPALDELRSVSKQETPRSAQTLAEAERHHILSTLEKTGWIVGGQGARRPG